MIFFEEERTKTSKDKRMVKLDFLIYLFYLIFHSKILFLDIN